MRLVPPRFCPPDKCSGVEPKIQEYKVVSKLLKEMFDDGMKSQSVIAAYSSAPSITRFVMEQLVPQLASLDVVPSAEQDVIALVEAMCLKWVISHPLDSFSAAENHLGAAAAAENHLDLLAIELVRQLPFARILKLTPSDLSAISIDRRSTWIGIPAAVVSPISPLPSLKFTIVDDSN